MNFLAVHSNTAFSLWRAAIWERYRNDDIEIYRYSDDGDDGDNYYGNDDNIK